MPRRHHTLTCAKTASCALGPFSVGYTMSISGRQRALTEFLRTTMVSFDGESLQTAVTEINRHNRRGRSLSMIRHWGQSPSWASFGPPIPAPFRWLRPWRSRRVSFRMATSFGFGRPAPKHRISFRVGEDRSFIQPIHDEHAAATGSLNTRRPHHRGAGADRPHRATGTFGTRIKGRPIKVTSG
jgi:hypothetical protein